MRLGSPSQEIKWLFNYKVRRKLSKTSSYRNRIRIMQKPSLMRKKENNYFINGIKQNCFL